MMKHTNPKHTRFYPIEGHTGYFISKETTQVLCLVDEFPVILNQIPNSKGKDNYYVVVLGDNKNHFIHRLMALTFLPEADHQEHVNHIDGNKQNNQLSNLEWATPQENAQHAVDTGLSTYNHFYKEVHQYELSGKYIQTFKSDAEAELESGVSKQNISKCTLGQRPHAGGYQWKRVKHPLITKVDNVVFKELRVVTPDNEVIIIKPNGQDYTTEACKLIGCGKHNLMQRFKAEGNITFLNGFKLEKIYFK